MSFCYKNKTEGFVLKKEDLRESDRIFTVYTKDFGKIKILGKAIRKIKSKLKGGMKLFSLSRIEFIQGKNYKTLTDAAIDKNYRGLEKNLIKLRIAYKISETLNDLIKGEEKDEEILDLLKEVFEKLDNYSLPIINYSLIYYYFLWNLLSILGYRLNLYECVICKNKLTPQQSYFNPVEGIVCSACFRKTGKGNEISPETIKILRLILERNWQVILRLKITANHQELLELISNDYLNSLFF